MPKVSDAHREARRRQILTAATACVAREGFHRTTMANVIAEAGLSAGAVYSYFPSKQVLIRTIADDALGLAATRLEALLHREAVLTLRDVVDEFIRSALETYGEDSPRIAVQVWAEAARDPQITDLAAERLLTLRGIIARLLERCQRDQTYAADADPEQAALVLAGLLPGYVFQRLLDPTLSSGPYIDAALALIGASAAEPAVDSG